MTLFSGYGTFGWSQVSVRLLIGNLVLFFLFSTSFIILVQANITKPQAEKLLKQCKDAIAAGEKSKSTLIPRIAPNDVENYTVELSERLENATKSMNNLNVIITLVALVSTDELNSAYKEVDDALTELGRLLFVLRSRVFIQMFSEIEGEWNRVRGELSDEDEKQAFKQQLNNVHLSDITSGLEALQNVPVSGSEEFQKLVTEFKREHFDEFEKKVVALRESLDDLNPKSEYSYLNIVIETIPAKYKMKRELIAGLVGVGVFGATYGLWPPFRHWVNSMIVGGPSSDSNETTITDTFEPTTISSSTTSTLSPESNGDFNAFVWIIIGVVLVALAGTVIYFFVGLDKKKISSLKNRVPKADDKSKKGNSDATTSVSSSNAISGASLPPSHNYILSEII